MRIGSRPNFWAGHRKILLSILLSAAWMISQQCQSRPLGPFGEEITDQDLLGGEFFTGGPELGIEQPNIEKPQPSIEKPQPNIEKPQANVDRPRGRIEVDDGRFGGTQNPPSIMTQPPVAPAESKPADKRDIQPSGTIIKDSNGYRFRRYDQFDAALDADILAELLPRVEEFSRKVTEMTQVSKSLGPANGKRLFINSGYRSPKSQAKAMRIKMDISGKYAYSGPKGKKVFQAYEKGKMANESPAQIELRMEAVLDAQLKTKNPISEHMFGRAIDIKLLGRLRIEDIDAIVKLGDKTTLIHLELDPPHIHVEFR